MEYVSKNCMVEFVRWLMWQQYRYEARDVRVLDVHLYCVQSVSPGIHVRVDFEH
jgi:hypothetical protein